MIFVSLLIRREHIRSLGFKRPQSWARMAGFAFIGVIVFFFTGPIYGLW
jgi:hypothetical protein